MLIGVIYGINIIPTSCEDIHINLLFTNNELMLIGFNRFNAAGILPRR